MLGLRHTRSIRLPIDKDLFISLISGSAAGIATTAAIVVGVIVGTDDRQIVVISSIVAIFVQAFNSSVNTIYTAHTIDEIENNHDKDSLLTPTLQAGLQFVTHMIAGMLVLLPVVYIVDLSVALIVSIAISLAMLAFIGFFVGRTLKHTPFINSIHSLLLGALVIVAGFAVGLLLND